MRLGSEVSAEVGSQRGAGLTALVLGFSRSRHSSIGLAAVLVLVSVATTDAAAEVVAGPQRPASGAIPYVTTLQPQAVRRHGRIVHGRIQLRAIVAADGLRTAWSIRIVRRHGGYTNYFRVIGHGTLGPAGQQTVTAVAFGSPGSTLLYEVTAANAAGGKPTPPQHARIA